VRSLHPTHSVAAFGKRAEAFVKGEERATSPCFEGGVWQRLFEENAIVLLIGVELNRNTYIHAVDEMLDLPNRLGDPISLTVIDKQGNEYSLSYRKHSEIVGSDFFENYRKPLEALGAMKNDVLGNAKVGIFYVAPATEVIKHLWSKADYDLCEVERDIPSEYYM